MNDYLKMAKQPIVISKISFHCSNNLYTVVPEIIGYKNEMELSKRTFKLRASAEEIKRIIKIYASKTQDKHS